MEKPIFPSKNMRITQGYDVGTHKNSYAIDNAGKDTNIEAIYAPFTGIIKKIYYNDANEVWLESVEKVEYPDGTIDYMNIMFAHADDISNLFVGKRINQNEKFYQEGTKGNATGNHCHFECGEGKFTNSGWHKNESNYWSINNPKKPEDCLWIDDTINIINNNNYNFKKISTNVVDKEIADNKNNEECVDKYKIKKEFIEKKKDLYGVYLQENDKVVIKSLIK